jgi:hypothetical protein
VPTVILQFLQSHCGGVTIRASNWVIPAQSYAKLRLRYVVRTLLQRNEYLTADEIAYVGQALETYRRYLATDWDSYCVELEQLRLRIAQFCYMVLESKLSRRELRHVSLVEHYLSAEHLKTVPLVPFLAVLK